MDIDLTAEPLGTGSDGRPVYLSDIWPSQAEIAAAVAQAVRPEMFRSTIRPTSSTATRRGTRMPVAEGELFAWDPTSTYIQEPPFFADLPATAGADPADPRRACWRRWAIR